MRLRGHLDQQPQSKHVGVGARSISPSVTSNVEATQRWVPKDESTLMATGSELSELPRRDISPQCNSSARPKRYHRTNTGAG